MAQHPFIPYESRLKAFARENRNHPTPAEKHLWSFLKSEALGVDFDRQRPLLCWIVDFYCKELMLAIELDGSSHWENEAHDMPRQTALEAKGIRMLRFSNERVLGQTAAVLDEIRSAIQERRREGF